MRILNVFYFYYCFFYKKILKEDNPIFTATFSLSFSLSLFINGVANIISVHILNNYLHMWTKISVFIGILVLSYFYYYRKGKARELIKEQPNFFGNKTLSVLLTILFFILTVSFLFWEPVYSKNVIDGR